jgi:S-adenosylmethionine hydrolase
MDADEIVRFEMPLARVEGDEMVAHAIGFDRFGNVMLDVEHAELAGSGLRLGRRVEVEGQGAVYASTFTDVAVGELLLYEDAYRTLSLAVNRGSAREALELDVDSELRIRPA